MRLGLVGVQVPDPARAAANARIGFPIAKTLGNCLSMANYGRLAALIGPARVIDLVYTARLVEAEEAKAIGLLSEILPDHAALQARAEALADNQEAVVAQQLAENWPEIVRAGATAFGNVDHMVLLNGADGMSEMFAKALTMGGTGLGLARQLLAAMNGTPAAGEGTPDGFARRGERVTLEGDA